MSRMQSLAGTILTRPEMHTIMPCQGDFTLSRIEAERDGKATDHVFEPPYRLRDGEAYAIYQAPAGGLEIWQVECVQRGEWRWVQEAKRARSNRPAKVCAIN
nr:hypothetical protein [Methylobacterium sp. ZNC0032]